MSCVHLAVEDIRESQLTRTGQAVISSGTWGCGMVSAQLVGVRYIEEYQYQGGTIHFDDEEGLLYLIQKVCIGRFPVERLSWSAGLRFTETASF